MQTFSRFFVTFRMLFLINIEKFATDISDYRQMGPLGGYKHERY